DLEESVFVVEDVVEDFSNSEVVLDHRVEADVELIHTVFGIINNPLNVIKKWKESTDHTWVYLQNGCMKLLSVVETLAYNSVYSVVMEPFNELKNIIPM
ncbi:hypothetical protein KI387_002890, partial [Taxus chinensis]